MQSYFCIMCTVDIRATVVQEWAKVCEIREDNQSVNESQYI